MIRTARPWNIQNVQYDIRQFTSFKEQIRRVNWDCLVQWAKDARDVAQSYRGFRVGCAIWATNTNASSLRDCSRVFVGGNTKIAQNARTVCAEQVAFGAARSSGYNKIVTLVIMAEPQLDQDGSMPLTLHPCLECLRVFESSPEFSSETVFLMIIPDETVYEEFTLGELLALHSEQTRNAFEHGESETL